MRSAVIQADRDAAAALYRDQVSSTEEWYVLPMQDGYRDKGEWVQAFARHRTQAQADALEEAAKVADKEAARACFNSDAAPEMPDRYYLAEEVRAKVAQAIRALIPLREGVGGG